MAQLICKRNSVGYNFRSQTDFSLPHVKSVNYGLYRDYCSYSDIQNSRTLQGFSKKFKSRIPQNCPCRICEKSIHQIGFTKIHERFNVNVE